MAFLDLTFGLLGSRMVSIDEIEPDKWGLRCGCKCAHCGADLEARSRRFTGRQRAFYFAHASGCGCEGARETALHRLVKETVAELDQLPVPPVLNSFPDCAKSFRTIRSVGHLAIHSSRVEAGKDHRRPDAILVTSIGEVCVEVFVTHAVDEAKIEDAKLSNWSLLEIDARPLLKTPFTRAKVTEWLKSGHGHREWVLSGEGRKLMRSLEDAAERVENGGECPAGLGAIALGDARNRRNADCLTCPACLGRSFDEDQVLCMWRSGTRIDPAATLDLAVSNGHPWPEVDQIRELRRLSSVRAARTFPDRDPRPEEIDFRLAKDESVEIARRTLQREWEVCAKVFVRISNELRQGMKVSASNPSSAIVYLVTETHFPGRWVYDVLATFEATTDTLDRPRQVGRVEHVGKMFRDRAEVVLYQPRTAVFEYRIVRGIKKG